MIGRNNPLRRRRVSMSWVVCSISVYLMTLGTWICRPLCLIRHKRLKRNCKFYPHCSKYKSITHSSTKKSPILNSPNSTKSTSGSTSPYLPSSKAPKCGRNSSNMYKTPMLKLIINTIFKSKRYTNSKRRKWKSPTRNKSVLLFELNVGNKMLLWHGSRLTNYVGILSKGLKIAPL